MQQINKGDLVILTNPNYEYIKAGSVGIVTSTWGVLINVTFPQGTGAFSISELKLLTKETTCTQ